MKRLVTDATEAAAPAFRPCVAAILGVAVILALVLAPSVQAAGFNVNSQVTFTPLAATYRTVSDTTGCPAGFSGKFTFTALLTNKPTSAAMPGVAVRVLTLTNGNLLQDPQTNTVLGGEGAVMQAPKTGQYADGLLSPAETLEVPMALCLRTREPFKFVVDVFGIVTQLVSINRFGTNGGNDSTFTPVINADGRFVVFESGADDLVANDANGHWHDMFVRDLLNQTTTLVTVNLSGNSGPGETYGPSISADGRFVSFYSTKNDLVANDTPGRRPGSNTEGDIFVRDLQTGTTTLVSVNRMGTDSGNNVSFPGPISANGRVVVFTSLASDLVTNDNDHLEDVYARDLQTGTTALVSVNQYGTNGSGGGNAGISADGRYVVFLSDADDLVPNDHNQSSDVFVRDLQTGTTTLVSVNRFGTNSGIYSSWVGGTISANGRYVLFTSNANDLVANDTNGTWDVFVRDLQTKTTKLVSVNRFGTASANDVSSNAIFSADGRFVAFRSYATDLASNDNDPNPDVFVRDLLTETTTLVSVNRFGTGGEDFVMSSPSGISADGRFVLFNSDKVDLVANDTNGQTDVFVRDLNTGTTTLISVNQAGTLSGNRGSGGGAMTADGRFVTFVSGASDLVTTNTNGFAQAFVRPVP